MASLLEAEVWGEAEALEASMAVMSNDELKQQTRALDNEIRIMRSDMNRIRHESTQQTAHIKDNKDKIKLNKQLPYLVANVVEIVEPYADPEEDGAATSLSLVPECRGAVVKTSTRQTVFLPMPGLIRADELKPGELVGTNKDSYIILEKLPTEFDSRVKAMEVDEKPTEDYTGKNTSKQQLFDAEILTFHEQFHHDHYLYLK